MALSERLGDEATGGFLDVLEASQTEWTEHVLTLAEARFDRRLTQEISALRVELHESLAAIRTEFTRELSAVRVELIRWSFVFWIGQVAVTIGVLVFMLRGIAR